MTGRLSKCQWAGDSWLNKAYGRLTVHTLAVVVAYVMLVLVAFLSLVGNDMIKRCGLFQEFCVLYRSCPGWEGISSKLAGCLQRAAGRYLFSTALKRQRFSSPAGGLRKIWNRRRQDLKSEPRKSSGSIKTCLTQARSYRMSLKQGRKRLSSETAAGEGIAVFVASGKGICYNPPDAEVAEWQTRRIQNPLPLKACGFKSHLRHFLKPL